MGIWGGGGKGLEGANRKKKNLRKNRKKKFDWKWSEKHWELQEIPLKAKERIGNP